MLWLEKQKRTFTWTDFDHGMTDKIMESQTCRKAWVGRDVRAHLEPMAKISKSPHRGQGIDLDVPLAAFATSDSMTLLMPVALNC